MRQIRNASACHTVSLKPSQYYSNNCDVDLFPLKISEHSYKNIIDLPRTVFATSVSRTVYRGLLMYLQEDSSLVNLKPHL